MTSPKTVLQALLLGALGALAAPPLLAQTAAPAAAAPAMAAAADLTSAEVRKVDKAQGKLTLKHGEIKNLDMPPMTMVFVVKDKAWIDQLKAGDKIRFRAENEGGKYTVVEIVPAAP